MTIVGDRSTKTTNYVTSLTDSTATKASTLALANSTNAMGTTNSMVMVVVAA